MEQCVVEFGLLELGILEQRFLELGILEQCVLGTVIPTESWSKGEKYEIVNKIGNPFISRILS